MKLFKESITNQSFVATEEQIIKMFMELNLGIKYGDDTEISVNDVINYINQEIIKDKNKLSNIEQDLYWNDEIRYETFPARTLDGKACMTISYLNTPKRYSDKYIKYEKPSVNPQLLRWIPVDERFPEDPGTYLVTYKSRGEKFVNTLQFSEEELDYYDNYIERIFRGYDVIAWAYMPEPYKED